MKLRLPILQSLLEYEKEQMIYIRCDSIEKRKKKLDWKQRINSGKIMEKCSQEHSILTCHLTENLIKLMISFEEKKKLYLSSDNITNYWKRLQVCEMLLKKIMLRIGREKHEFME